MHFQRSSRLDSRQSISYFFYSRSWRGMISARFLFRYCNSCVIMFCSNIWYYAFCSLSFGLQQNTKPLFYFKVISIYDLTYQILNWQASLSFINAIIFTRCESYDNVQFPFRWSAGNSGVKQRLPRLLEQSIMILREDLLVLRWTDKWVSCRFCIPSWNKRNNIWIIQLSDHTS